MPTYVYKCERCDSTFERRQSFSDAPLTTHDLCGAPVRKLIVAAPVIFKGSGFYSTDHRAGTNGSSEQNGAKEGSEKGEGAKGESAKAESAKAESSEGMSAKGESSKAETSKSESSSPSKKAASTAASD